jgi:hypothetical protein
MKSRRRRSSLQMPPFLAAELALDFVLYGPGLLIPLQAHF